MKGVQAISPFNFGILFVYYSLILATLASSGVVFFRAVTLYLSIISLIIFSYSTQKKNPVKTDGAFLFIYH